MYRPELTKVVRNVLESKNFHELSYVSENDFDQLTLGFNLNCKYDAVLAQVIIFETSVVVRVLCPEQADSSTRFEVAKYLSMANWGIRIGGFEMNMDTGEIDFRSTIEAIDLPASTELTILSQIIMSGRVFNQYGDGIYDVIHRRSDAKAAIAKAEG